MTNILLLAFIGIILVTDVLTDSLPSSSSFSTTKSSSSSSSSSYSYSENNDDHSSCYGGFDESNPTPSIICGPDEVYDGCVNGGCGRWNCSQPGVICIKLIEGACREGCRCKEGYLRNDEGTCIPEDKCPEKTPETNPTPSIICGPDEVYDGCVNGGCGRWNCSQPGVICIDLIEGACREGCRCKEGYLRADDETCVPEDKCPEKTPEPNPTPSIICGPDEVYDGCVNGGCGRWNCSQPGVICIDLIEGACREGCRCKEGYLRNDEGTCIPEDKCPAICTGLNEVSGCKSACPIAEQCESVDKKINCPIQRRVCIPACLCKEGYYRNKIGECISKEQCLKCNGPHEYYSCGGACDNVCKTLSEQNQTNCPIINVKCNEMCYCEKGYARDSNGTCIPIDKCPSNPPITCGPDEVYDSCVNGGCGRFNCSRTGVICIDVRGDACKEGCSCKEGYLRNDEGTCIPEDKCPAICTGLNEVSGCKSACPIAEQCESVDKKINCPIQRRVCIPACLCKEGYYRNKIGECISKEQCLKCNGPHEYYSCGGACDNVCKTLSEQNQTNCPIINVKCNEMCYCEKGYARDSNGTCIPIDKCPPNPPITCGPDEVYDSCVNGGCGRFNCSRTGIICIDVRGDACKEGCSCKEGYLRNDEGTCIPEDKCPAICTGLNEVSGCKSACPIAEQCESVDKKINCPIQRRVCIPACLCKEGYYRNKIGECISKEQCLKCYGPHEYYSCGGACDNVCKTLSEQNQTNCPIINVKCNEMCYCEKGYARDSNGTCIPIDKCPPNPPITCGPDEVYDSCVNGGCGRFNCSRTGIICIDVRGDACKEGCSCKEGYLRNDEGTCIPEDKCPAICTGLNEVSGCKSACPIAEQCESVDKKINCPIQRRVCIPACLCKEGYYRNKIGECISKEQCLKCNGPHEYYSCGGACDNVCKTLSEQNQTNCPIINVKCNEMCYCEKGYARDSNGTCIPIDKCPPNPPITCGPDEVYDSCVNGGCGRFNCSRTGIICIDVRGDACKEGCSCKEGYLRNDEGTCIPEDKCPAICTGLNEVSGCKSACPIAEQCESVDKKINCPIQRRVCIPACLCKEGYYRNKIGECISKEQCLKCNGPHEYYSCGGACDNVCKTLSEQNQTNCPIINVKCNEMCYCEKGYARDSNGTCIPIDKCPPNPPITCGPDEVYDSCVNGGCGRFNCSRTGIICIDVRGDACKEGCSCKEGYLRNDEGTCIPEDKCPAICTGLNEVSGCKSACPIAEQCESVDKKINCPIQRRVCIPACLCKEGYYRNKIGECISKEQCLKCNGPHEYYSCGGACDNVCKTLSEQNQTNCPIINVKCNEMCYCEKGYARDSNGTCIPIDKCPVNGNGNKSGVDKFSKGNEFFTEYFLSVASNMNPGISAIYSPFSLLFLLAQLALYANGLTLEQLLAPVNINQKQIRTAIPKYLTDLYAQQNVNISLVERVYVNEKYKLSVGFKKDSKDIFRAEAKNLDFGNPSNAAKDINSWVANQTHDLIKNFVNPIDFDENTRIVIINALYFKSNWGSPFKKQNTKKWEFYVDQNKNVTVDMMYQEASFNYAKLSKLNIQAVELPYKNSNFTLLVLLPKAKDGLGELIASVGDTSFSVLEQVKAKLKSQRVALSLPSIKTTTTTDSKTILEKMDIKRIFYPETANLTGMLKQHEPLYVSAAIQKATITLDENGTEAAAANEILISATAAMVSSPKTVEFNADHPFAYFIMFENTPIFCGAYAGPQ